MATGWREDLIVSRQERNSSLYLGMTLAKAQRTPPDRVAHPPAITVSTVKALFCVWLSDRS